MADALRREAIDVRGTPAVVAGVEVRHPVEEPVSMEDR
jgi:hypothetical protein